MSVSDMIQFAAGKIMGSKNKVPLIIFAVAILSKVYNALCNLIYAVFGYVGFFWAINDFFNILNTVAFIALAVYLILLFVKQKQPLYLVAGILSFLSILGFASLMRNIVWLVFAVCLSLPGLRSGEDEHRPFAKMALLPAAVVTVLGLLSSALWRLPQFLIGLYNVIYSAVFAVQLAALLVLVLCETEAVGDVKGVVDDLITKAENRVGSDKNEKVMPEPEIHASQEIPASPAPVSDDAAAVATAVAAGIGAVAAVSKANGSSGRYQYKTVAGPVGLTVSKNTNYADGVKQYAAIIDRESVGGWVLDSIQEIPVTKRAGCLASLFGRADVTVYFNMLIFRKED